MYLVFQVASSLWLIEVEPDMLRWFLFLAGYAWSGAGHMIVRVDVTADRGKTWHVAHFTHQDTKSKPPHHWAWKLWKAEIPITSGEKQVQNTYMKSAVTQVRMLVIVNN
jgi:hypothetical protein